MPTSPPRARAPEGPSRRSSGASLASVALALAAVACGVAACSGAPSAGASPSASPGSDAGSGDAAAYPKTPEGLFRALQTDLMTTCGGTGGACHVSGTLKDAPRWLAPPDAYLSAKGYRGVIPADGDLEHSVLLTQIEHTGPALVNSPALWPRVREWIAAEMNVVKAPETAPFAITPGLNTVDLGGVMAGLDGASLAFMAAPGQAGVTLTDMRITGAKLHVLRVESPYVVVVPDRGPVVVDPSNGFAGELSVGIGETKAFYGGVLVLPKWTATDRLAVAFSTIHLENPPDPGTAGGCRSVASFTASAVPAFQIDLGGGATCLGCHAGGDDVATNALDLTAVGTSDARACAQALNYVDLADKARSQLVQTPLGHANPVHPITNAPQSFADGVLRWLANE
jgi:hypothetical protein